ncbi:MAG: ATP-binding protein [Rhodanobacteraceae bacterium]
MRAFSLANRVSLLVGLTAAVLLGAAAVLMDNLIDTELRHRFDSSLLVQAQAVSALIEDGPQGLQMEAGGRPIEHPLLPSLTQSFLARCSNGRTLSHGPHAGLALAAVYAAYEPMQAAYSTLGTGPSQQRAVQISFALNDEAALAPGARRTTCRLLLMQSIAPLEDILLETDAILIAVPMAVLFLVLVLSPWLVRRGLKPLAALCEQMSDIGPQEIGRRLPASRIGEIRPLVERFNEVLARMDEGVLRERRFAGAVAHETRTSLAELRTLLDVELRHPSQRPTSEILGEVSILSGELESTVSALLLLTRLEAGIEVLQPSSIDPIEVVEAQLTHLEAPMAARQQQVETTFSARAIRLSTDRDLLRLIIANLLSNATAYAPEGDTVVVTVEQEQLCVRNRAPGLDPHDIPYLGQRYWQKQRNSDAHTGLGLSLAGAAARVLGLSLSFALDENGMFSARLDWTQAALAVNAVNAVSAG